MKLPNHNQFAEAFSIFHKRPKEKGGAKVATFIKAVYSELYTSTSRGKLKINNFSELVEAFLAALADESHPKHPRQIDPAAYKKNPKAYNITIDKIQACLALAVLIDKCNLYDNIGVPSIIKEGNYEPASIPFKDRSYNVLVAANNKYLLFFDGNGIVKQTPESMKDVIDQNSYFFCDYLQSLQKLLQIFNDIIQEDDSFSIYNLNTYAKEIIAGIQSKPTLHLIELTISKLPWLLLTKERIKYYHAQFIINNQNNNVVGFDWMEFTNFIIIECNRIQQNIIDFMNIIFNLLKKYSLQGSDICHHSETSSCCLPVQPFLPLTFSKKPKQTYTKDGLKIPEVQDTSKEKEELTTGEEKCSPTTTSSTKKASATGKKLVVVVAKSSKKLPECVASSSSGDSEEDSECLPEFWEGSSCTSSSVSPADNSSSPLGVDFSSCPKIAKPFF